MKKILRLIRAILNTDDLMRFKLATKVFKFLYPKYFIGHWGKIAFEDQELLNFYDSSIGLKSPESFERKYNLKELIKLTEHIDGDTVELGVYKGYSSYLILQSIQGKKKHHMFDSWDGLPAPKKNDGEYWQKGDLISSLDECKELLEKYDEDKKIYYQGWIPETFKKIDNKIKFSFIHFDLDLYEPTMFGLQYFYNKLNKGGLMLFDDYTFKTCPGVKLAVDEFLLDKEESLICLTTQAFFIKR